MLCGTLEIVILEVLWSIRGSFSAVWSLPLKNDMVFWPLTSSDFLTDTIFHHFYDIDTKLDLHRIISGFHEAFATGLECQQATLTIPDTCSVPLFGTCLCCNCWDQIPGTCHVFTRLFILNTHWYFFDFAFRDQIITHIEFITAMPISWDIGCTIVARFWPSIFNCSNQRTICGSTSLACCISDKRTSLKLRWLVTICTWYSISFDKLGSVSGTNLRESVSATGMSMPWICTTERS